ERFTTARYQLSHAGVHASEHTTVWFGSCSYNKMKVESLPREKKLCPVCGMEFRLVYWVGQGDKPPPLADYKFVRADWIYAPLSRYHKKTDYKPFVSADSRYCLVKPTRIKLKPLVEHTFEALREANPEAPDWWICRYLNEGG
ncbi:hypothetical protein MUP77_09980, partial [Candidatus Bathyarchaeota archaeon]|nr:hypothetical protein [Candidatus Bathyarchaeota archaeon]